MIRLSPMQIPYVQEVFSDSRGALLTIWPEPYKSEFRAVTIQDRMSGEIFYVFDDSRLVGITGIFFDDDCPDDIFLRWTGILPAERRKGYAAQVILQLVGMCQLCYKSYSRLIELVPDNDYGHTVATPFFKALGFEEHKEGRIPGSEVGPDYGHVVYAYDLKKVRK